MSESSVFLIEFSYVSILRAIKAFVEVKLSDIIEYFLYGIYRQSLGQSPETFITPILSETVTLSPDHAGSDRAAKENSFILIYIFM